MERGTLTKLIASIFSIIAFVTALFAGAVAGLDGATVIARALLALFICQLVGHAIGVAVERTLREHVEHYKSKHPIPKPPDELLEPISE